MVVVVVDLCFLEYHTASVVIVAATAVDESLVAAEVEATVVAARSATSHLNDAIIYRMTCC
jgi:hypothetical protein